MIAAALGPTSVAWAALKGTSSPSGALTATASSWAALATTAATGPYAKQALVLSFATNGSSAPAAKYFYVTNIGSLTLSTGTYSVVASPVVTTLVESCSAVWNEGTGACSGTITTVVGSTASPATTARCPAAVGSSIRLRARITASIASTTSVTVGVTLTRSQARAATTTTS